MYSQVNVADVEPGFSAGRGGEKDPVFLGVGLAQYLLDFLVVHGFHLTLLRVMWMYRVICWLSGWNMPVNTPTTFTSSGLYTK